MDDTIIPAPPALTPAITQTLVPAPGALEQQRVREQQWFDRKLAADDKARADTGTVTLAATAAFTMVDDPDVPEGRVIQAGQEFRISVHDLPRYKGRGVVPALEAGGPGVIVARD